MAEAFYIMNKIAIVKGKTRCPYCSEYVIVEVPDGSTGIQTTTCPNCGMKIKVDVKEREREEEEMKIHPTMQEIRGSKIRVAGALLIAASMLGIAMGGFGIFISSSPIFHSGYGNYEFYVVDSYGNGIGNASIYVDGKFVGMSQPDGYFSMENITAGKHLMEIEKDGYKKLAVRIFVLPSKFSFMTKAKQQFELHEGDGSEKTSDIFTLMMKLFPLLSMALIIISIIPLAGGIFCILKKSFAFSLIASIFGIFSIGFFIGSILSIVALILIILNRHEFAGEVKY